MFSLQDYDYNLPEERIAQKPAERRDGSRLLVLKRDTGHLVHRHFYEIDELLLPSDMLVINNTEVIPGRLYGKKASGGQAEILILNYGSGAKQEDGAFICRCLVKTAKKPKPGTIIFLEHGIKAEITEAHEGVCTVRFFCNESFESLLYRIGNMPLPPYIRRNIPCNDDKQSYHTVYAAQKGAIAAPTAGLHFTEELLNRLKNKGVTIVPITLHVGYGTFLPVRVSDIREHRMHSEWYSISQETANTVNTAKQEGRRVIAVGTTCVRTLEYAANAEGKLNEGIGECNLFIYPGYRFKLADAMITNFHLPQSTLLMLVSAFAGRKTILKAYQEAIDKQYRFYSYGDAMLII